MTDDKQGSSRPRRTPPRASQPTLDDEAVRERRDARLRKWAMFVAALMLTAYEGLIREAERPALLVLYAGMMGLPLMLPSGGAKGGA